MKKNDANIDNYDNCKLRIVLQEACNCEYIEAQPLRYSHRSRSDQQLDQQQHLCLEHELHPYNPDAYESAPSSYVDQCDRDDEPIYAGHSDSNACHSDDESAAILSSYETPMEPPPPPPPLSTPLARCCYAFWDLFQFLAVLLSVCWVCFLSILLIQPSMMNVRSIIADIDPISTKLHPIPHRINSRQTCSNYDLSTLSQELNVYLLFHFLRWFVYALIYRNRCILWINSILWELIQFSVASVSIFNLQWMGQCWYNSIILDVLITNMLGIELGYAFMKKLNICQVYDRLSDMFRCRMSAFPALLVIWCTVMLFQLQQLLMFIIFDQSFWHNTDGWMIWCRLVIYALSSMYCTHQLYEWIDTKMYQGMQSLSFALILNFLVLFELLLSIKTYGDEYL